MANRARRRGLQDDGEEARKQGHRRPRTSPTKTISASDKSFSRDMIDRLHRYLMSIESTLPSKTDTVYRSFE
jgi:hypothetical protein